MPATPRPSDDPAERRQRRFNIAQEIYQTALDRNALDVHDGRIPTYGSGAIALMAELVEEARAAVEDEHSWMKRTGEVGLAGARRSTGH